MTTYEPVIGLEIHAQTNTKTKMFCGCDNDSFRKDPNTNVCPICMGFPGMLPVINKEAYEKGIKAALALNCKIPSFSKFDRKNYFYPDSPKGFQISQFDQPVSVDGHVEFEADGELKKVGITRLHLEDDAGKLTHVGNGSLCDFNRAGTPLMEIVSEPELYSTQEASAYARELQRLLRFVGASDCDMEKGMMRFDINISIREKGAKELGVKVEVKNLNSFRFLEKALDYEFKRQVEAMESGEEIVQETRGWDTKQEMTVSQRSKEEAHDYRYFPEPDLPPMKITDEDITKLKESLPELPFARKKRFEEEFEIDQESSKLLTETPEMADFFEEVAKKSGDAKKANAFITTVLIKHLKDEQKPLKDCKITTDQLSAIIKLVGAGDISNNQAKGEVFDSMYKTGKDPKEIIEEKGLKQVSDTGEIEGYCKKVIEENPEAAEDVKNGKDRAIGFLVGQVMQLSKGQANPGIATETIKKLLK